jgi:hypothetical protein
VFLCLNVKIGHGKVGKIENGAADGNEWEDGLKLPQELVLQRDDLHQANGLQPICRLKMQC